MLVVLDVLDVHESHLLFISILGVRWQQVWVECDPDAYLSLCEYLVLMTNIGIEGVLSWSFKIHQLQGMW